MHRLSWPDTARLLKSCGLFVLSPTMLETLCSRARSLETECGRVPAQMQAPGGALCLFFLSKLPPGVGQSSATWDLCTPRASRPVEERRNGTPLHPVEGLEHAARTCAPVLIRGGEDDWQVRTRVSLHGHVHAALVDTA